MIRRWREIERWIEDAESGHAGTYAERPLSEFIARRVEPIDRDARPLDVLNVIAKISFGGDLHLRSEEAKRGYKGPLFEALPGDLVVSKIRVAQGSLCVVPDTLEHLAVSPEYPIYAVDHEQVRAQFLQLVIRSTVFQARVGRLRAGNTTKARIRPAQFEALNIPVPTPKEQDALIAAYTDALHRAAQLEQAAEAIERAGWQAFETALGVAPPPPLPDRPVFVARFKDVERWSHDGFLRGAVGNGSATSEALTEPLGNALLEVRHGCSKGPSKKATSLRVLKISAVTKGRLDLEEHKFIADEHALREQFALKAGDILMCRTNGTLAYVGMSALVDVDIDDMIFPDKVIRVRPNLDKIEPGFLWRLLQVPAVRSQIEAAARTAVGNFAIGGKDIKALKVPLPLPARQKALAQSLNNAVASAKSKRTEAATLRQYAWAAFEAALFTATEEPSA